MPISNPDYSNLDYADMAKSIGLKEKHIPILIASFLEESMPILENLKAAIASSNYTDIRSFAHSIKGSSGNLHFNEVYEMSKEVEFAGNAADTAFDYNGYYEAILKAVSTIQQ